MKRKSHVLLQAVDRLLSAHSLQEIERALGRIHSLNRQMDRPRREFCQEKAIQMAQERMLRNLPAPPEQISAPPAVTGVVPHLPEQALASSLFAALCFAGSQGLALSELCYSEEIGFWLASPRTLASMQDGEEYRRAMELYCLAVHSGTPMEAAESGRQFRRALLQRLLRWMKTALPESGNESLAELRAELEQRMEKPVPTAQEVLSKVMDANPPADGTTSPVADKQREKTWSPDLQLMIEGYSECNSVLRLYWELDQAKIPLPAEETRLFRLYVVLYLTNGAPVEEEIYNQAVGGYAG